MTQVLRGISEKRCFAGSENHPAGVVLILVCVQVETNYPGPCCQASECFGVCRYSRQASFKLTHDPLHRLENPIGKFLLAQLIPYMLLGIEFRRISGEPVQANVFWNLQFLGSVGTGSVHNRDDEFLCMRLADLFQELVHLLGVHLWADLPIQFSLHGADRAIDIGKLPFVAVVHHRARRRRRPTASNPHHPSETSLVLEHDPHPPRSHGFRCQQGRQVFGEFFSKPPEFADHSWDDACPELPSAIHDAPGTGRRQKLPPSAPSAVTAQLESATKPTLHRQALVLPKAAGTPVLPFRSSACAAVRPNPGGRGRRRPAGGTQTGAGTRLLVLRLTHSRSAPARHSTRLAATPPTLAGVRGYPGFAAQSAVRMRPTAHRLFVALP